MHYFKIIKNTLLQSKIFKLWKLPLSKFLRKKNCKKLHEPWYRSRFRYSISDRADNNCHAVWVWSTWSTVANCRHARWLPRFRNFCTWYSSGRRMAYRGSTISRLHLILIDTSDGRTVGSVCMIISGRTLAGRFDIWCNGNSTSWAERKRSTR